MADADLTLVVVDLSSRRRSEDRALIARAAARARCWWRNKCDLAAAVGRPGVLSRRVARFRAHRRGHSRTARGDSGSGRAQAARLEQETGFITSLRHEQLLRESAGYLDKAAAAAEAAIPHEMLLLDLYAALRPIDAITGATTADDILNRIFSTFCIGK